MNSTERSKIVSGRAGKRTAHELEWGALDDESARQVARARDLDAEVGVYSTASTGVVGPSPGHEPAEGAHAAAGRMIVTPAERIPPPIREAIRAPAEDQDTFSIASQLFVEDASDSRPDDRLAEGRLEHAVARATLEAWRHGLGSAVSVGQAYAAVGKLVAQTSRE